MCLDRVAARLSAALYFRRTLFATVVRQLFTATRPLQRRFVIDRRSITKHVACANHTPPPRIIIQQLCNAINAIARHERVAAGGAEPVTVVTKSDARHGGDQK
eukprot:1846814-Pyramimonas_sp.AAC.1